MYEASNICINTYRASTVCMDIHRASNIRMDIYRASNVCMNIYGAFDTCMNMYGSYDICMNTYMYIYIKYIHLYICIYTYIYINTYIWHFLNGVLTQRGLPRVFKGPGPCRLPWALVGRALVAPPGLLWAPVGPTDWPRLHPRSDTANATTDDVIVT